MHEMSLTESIVEIAVEAAEREGASRSPPRVRRRGLAQPRRARGASLLFRRRFGRTIAEGATLEIQPVPGAGWCIDCGKTVPLAERFGPCPACGGHHVQMTAGDEMRVREMEVE